MGMVMLSVPAAANYWSFIQPRYEPQNTSLNTPWWDYAGRSPYTYDLYGWSYDLLAARWPARSGFMGDPAAPCSLIASQDFGFTNGPFEPWLLGLGGCQALKFVMGRCLDISEVAVPNAVVQGFRTTTDEFVREVTADASGYYEFGTPFTGEGHYLVAYKAGSPDIFGTTANTLIPTNRDGT